MKQLDPEEQELLDAFDSGVLNQIANVDSELKQHKEYAKATFQKDARINIRISSKDLRLIQKRALSEGLPYQTLISSLLHKYAEGRLVENG
jgi:predicted DNA binding CopG/RHH family protein